MLSYFLCRTNQSFTSCFLNKLGMYLKDFIFFRDFWGWASLHEQGRGAEGERESQTNSRVSKEPHSGLDLTILKS